MKINTVDTVIKDFRDGQNIFRRPSVELMVREISQLQQRIAELEAEIKESNGLLRSAFMIAKRDGKETNWEAWHNQLSVALARQHVMIYGKD